MRTNDEENSIEDEVDYQALNKQLKENCKQLEAELEKVRAFLTIIENRHNTTNEE